MIDVLIPYYGSAALMREAVESVLAQTQMPNQIIIVDDCSPQSDLDMLRDHFDHPLIRYVRNDVNLGVRGNFVRTLHLASADYVVFLGCDDRLRPDFVAASESAIKRLANPAILQCGVCVIDESGTPHLPLADRVKRAMRPSGEGTIAGDKAAASLLTGNWAYFPSLVWHRPTITDVGFADYEIVLDLRLILDVLLGGGEIGIHDDVLFEYRRHAESHSSVHTASTTKRFDEERELFSEMAKRLSERGWRRASRAARWHLTSRMHAALAGASALSAGERRLAMQALHHSITAG